MTDTFALVKGALERVSEDDQLVEPLLQLIPLSGVSVATLGNALSAETIAASDRQIARIDELQFDLSEGPCWEAVSSGRPVLESAIQRDGHHAWPSFAAAIKEHAVGAIFAFPLRVGPLQVGAVELYDTSEQTLSEQLVDEMMSLTRPLSRYVLRRTVELAALPDASQHKPHARRRIHQATGFVIAQLGLSPDDAHLFIQAQAYAQNRPMAEVAEDIIELRTGYVLDDTTIEDVS
ncbi:MAG TPA: GAF and ANTAR domain-containing protein [Plantibacter sp.]|uniref:GAF and ANTAR domain-containing protein n=1 Tax=unclassified Plantibacter TaxID=2624265 RepID=UPI002CD531EA|nr:GAF and ANTAR domain-containing protein [Plantibacter sp.]